MNRNAGSWCGTALAVTLASVAPANAASAIELVHLEYHAPASCAQRPSFLQAVRARTDRLREAGPGEDALVLRVTLAEQGGAFQGRLESRARDGVESERTIHGTTCANVASALALIVALAIDPEAAMRAKAAPPEPAPARDVPPPPADSPSESASSKPLRASWEAGLRASVQTAVAPDPLLAFGGYVRFLAPQPSALLSIQHGGQTANTTSGGGEIDFTFAYLEVCPAELGLAAGVQVAACVAAWGGLVVISGVDTPANETVRRPWLAPGLTGRVGIRAGPIAVTPGVGVAVPLFRDRYFIRPSTTVHQVPWGDLHAGLAAGIALE